MCDDNCTIVLDKTKLFAIKSNKIDIKLDRKNIFMEGIRNHCDGLYNIPVEKQLLQLRMFCYHNYMANIAAAAKNKYIASKHNAQSILSNTKNSTNYI